MPRRHLASPPTLRYIDSRTIIVLDTTRDNSCQTLKVEVDVFGSSSPSGALHPILDPDDASGGGGGGGEGIVSKLLVGSWAAMMKLWNAMKCSSFNQLKRNDCDTDMIQISVNEFANNALSLIVIIIKCEANQYCFAQLFQNTTLLTTHSTFKEKVDVQMDTTFKSHLPQITA